MPPTLNWSHFIELLSIKNENEFDFYEKLCSSNLKAIRKKEKPAKEELATKSELKQSAIDRLEKGTNDIQLLTLVSYLKPTG